MTTDLGADGGALRELDVSLISQVADTAARVLPTLGISLTRRNFSSRPGFEYLPEVRLETFDLCMVSAASGE